MVVDQICLTEHRCYGSALFCWVSSSVMSLIFTLMLKRSVCLRSRIFYITAASLLGTTNIVRACVVVYVVIGFGLTTISIRTQAQARTQFRGSRLTSALLKLAFLDFKGLEHVRTGQIRYYYSSTRRYLEALQWTIFSGQAGSTWCYY